MGIWFRRHSRSKYHLATYGGSIAECGRDIHIAAAYAKDRFNLNVDDKADRKDLCQACINSIMRGREYIRELEAKWESKKNSQH